MTEHTPGPWSWAAYSFGRPEDGPTRFRIVGSDLEEMLAFTGDYSALDEANARLMAAAPDLLAACEGLLAAISNGDKPRCDDVIAAIAKARGREVAS